MIVGRNNAGKSTVVEALTLLSQVVNKLKGLSFSPAPSWLEVPRRVRGVSPALDVADINLRTIFHRYGNSPAKVSAVFESGDRVELYVGNERPFLYATFVSGKRVAIASKADVRHLKVDPIHVLPQVGPLAQEEQSVE